jgi:hypothetical protein
MDFNGELVVTDMQSNTDTEPMKVCKEKCPLIQQFNILPQIAVNSGATPGFNWLFVA